MATIRRRFNKPAAAVRARMAQKCKDERRFGRSPNSNYHSYIVDGNFDSIHPNNTPSPVAAISSSRSGTRKTRKRPAHSSSSSSSSSTVTTTVTPTTTLSSSYSLNGIKKQSFTTNYPANTYQMNIITTDDNADHDDVDDDDDDCRSSTNDSNHQFLSMNLSPTTTTTTNNNNISSINNVNHDDFNYTGEFDCLIQTSSYQHDHIDNSLI
ncbi:unnamed protein product [Schistosoma turkestanicum]|nr:unnamed protein product [Schistosoma turkestanicum]